MFGFRQLDVYQCAIEFVRLALPMSNELPRGYGSLADQLRRAAWSVPLNIAEGTGRFRRDGRRFYTIARGSALECAAIFDLIREIDCVSNDELEAGVELLERVVSLLSRMSA